MRQCSMSRKVKFSSNWNKAQARVQKIHNGFACTRKDFLHKTTTTISPNHALACIKDLRVRNMSRHSKLSKGNSEPRPADEAKVGPKPPACHFRPGLGRIQGRVQARARIQVVLERCHVTGRCATQQQSHMPALRSRIKRQSANASNIHVRRLQLRKSRRCLRDQCFRAGTPVTSLCRDDSVRPLEEAGTHRSDSQIIALRPKNPRPLGGEDVYKVGSSRSCV